MPEIKTLFRSADLMRIVAANIRDGEQLQTHDRAFSLEVALAVRQLMSVKQAAGQITGPPTECQYLDTFQDVVNGPVAGRMNDYPIYAGSRFLFHRKDPLDRVDHGWFTTITTLDIWLSLLTDTDGKRIFNRTRWRSRSGARDPKLLAAISRDRTGFMLPALKFRFGNPVAWFTPRDEFEKTIADSTNRADAARDLLGLVHRDVGAHLVAIHFPAAALRDVENARPTFADAGRHRRFMSAAAKHPAPFPFPWGQTLDLDAFETGKSLADGKAERVFATITGKSLGGAALQYEYLGKCLQGRGKAGVIPARFGTDTDFADQLVARERSAFDQIVDFL